MSRSTQQPVLFAAACTSPVQMAFDAEALTSDGGLPMRGGRAARQLSNERCYAADGAGMVVATVGENDNGAISAPSPQPAAAYSVAPDGTLTLPSSTGGLAADGAAGSS